MKKKTSKKNFATKKKKKTKKKTKTKKKATDIVDGVSNMASEAQRSNTRSLCRCFIARTQVAKRHKIRKRIIIGANLWHTQATTHKTRLCWELQGQVCEIRVRQVSCCDFERVQTIHLGLQEGKTRKSDLQKKVTRGGGGGGAEPLLRCKNRLQTPSKYLRDS